MGTGTVTVNWLDSGDSGVGATFAAMAKLANGGQTTPSVVGLARQIAAATGSRDPAAWAVAIQRWLSGVWMFVEDPVDTELLISPARMFEEYASTGRITGDCDEAAIMGAALGKSIGIPATFTALAFDTPDDSPERLAHVFATLLPNDGSEVSLDITKPAGAVPPVTRAVTVDV